MFDVGADLDQIDIEGFDELGDDVDVLDSQLYDPVGLVVAPVVILELFLAFSIELCEHSLL